MISFVSHLMGNGCPDCGLEKSIQSQYSNKFFNENPEKKKEKAILYLVKITSKKDNNIFYKIGVTIYDVKRRFIDLIKFFKIEELLIKQDTLYNVFVLEQKLLKQIKQTQDRPKKTKMYKNGESECFFADDKYIENLKVLILN